MGNLEKKLHGLRAVLTEGNVKLSFQKTGAEEILVIVQIGTQREPMHVTPSQLHEIANNLDQWDRESING